MIGGRGRGGISFQAVPVPVGRSRRGRADRRRLGGDARPSSVRGRRSQPWWSGRTRVPGTAPGPPAEGGGALLPRSVAPPEATACVSDRRQVAPVAGATCRVGDWRYVVPVTGVKWESVSCTSLSL